jgi:CheY-like chemotaxis protein
MKRYILVVDDQERWRLRMREEMSEFECEILTAEGMHSAEDLIEKHAEELALVVCDNSMPIGDRTFPNLGLEILEGMRLRSQAQAAIPFILFTSEANANQRARAEKHNGYVLLKRENIEGELADFVRRLLAS